MQWNIFPKLYVKECETIIHTNCNLVECILLVIQRVYYYYVKILINVKFIVHNKRKVCLKVLIQTIKNNERQKKSKIQETVSR